LNFEETLTYLYEKLPMYQRVGPVAFKKDLGNIAKLCEALGQPQEQFKSIHIAGTNGKGSVTHILAAILINAGYRVGYYTSPHLVSFRERIRINGQMITKDEVVGFVEQHRGLIEEIEPSFFEITVAMAFDYFARQEIDIAIVETGLGGRLDSTNIVKPLLSVITNIGHDHMDMLGDTLEAIAGEKAGIIKPNTPVVIGQKQEAVADVFLAKAKELNADICFADEANTMEWIDSDLKGFYQQINIRTALKTLDILVSEHDFDIGYWRTALQQVGSLSGLQGRWQKVGERPLVITDTGHNEEGIIQVVKNLAAEKYDNLHMVFGMVQGKNYKEVLNMFPKDANYYLVKPEVPRGLDVQELYRACSDLGIKSSPYSTIKDAYEAARSNANVEDCIFVGGSTFTVADFLAYLD